MTPAEMIRNTLREYGLTQSALAEAYGCAPGPMSQFLTGVRPIPDMARMMAALSALLPGFVVSVETEIIARGGDLKEDLFYLSVRPWEPWPDDEPGED